MTKSMTSPIAFIFASFLAYQGCGRSWGIVAGCRHQLWEDVHPLVMLWVVHTNHGRGLSSHVIKENQPQQKPDTS